MRNIARYAAQKLAAVEEGKRIAQEENRAYAAGQAVGRALHKLRGDR